MHTAVLSKNFLDRASDLLAYYLLISEADCEVPDCYWMGYDCLFREKAVSGKSLPWGLAGPSLWVTYIF